MTIAEWLKSEVDRLKKYPVGQFVNPEAMKIHQEMYHEAYRRWQKWSPGAK